jgi:o-succinylbenzoate synthase
MFTFDARTSRGAMTERPIWILTVTEGLRTGKGEVAPIARLSPENLDELPEFLEQLQHGLMTQSLPSDEREIYSMVAALVPEHFPSVRFGLEMALLDLFYGGKGLIFPSEFTQGKKSIPINGLVWMADRKTMRAKVDEKVAQGFECIKLKVGALKFEDELALLHEIRDAHPLVELRLDANGAFQPREVLMKLEKLAEYGIHSIEQPIMPRQPEAMALICEKSPIPIALDEELIGVHDEHLRKELLEEIRPDFVVLKPTLLGGFDSVRRWIDLAGHTGVDWWITSYLESNIGLTAIAQFTALFESELPQGLGTGGLYGNNFQSRLALEHGLLKYK